MADREAHLLALVKGFAQIVWITDRDGNVLSDAQPPTEVADLTWSAFTGLSQHSLNSSGWTTALHPADLPVVAATIDQARSTGAPTECEFRIHHRSGEWRWVVCRGVPVRSEEGVIEGWLGFCMDITRARQTEDAYRESQQRLIAALDAGGMSTWIWDLTDNNICWDEAAERLWGFAAPTRSGKLHEVMLLIHEDDRALLLKACADVAATGIVRGVEFRTARNDGRLQWLQSRGRVERDANGTPVRVIGAFVDVTRLKTTEDSLRQAQKMQALGTLAGGIAHDFNNLLLTISGNARLASSDLEQGHAAQESLSEISKAAARASDLVHRILTFSARQPATASVTPLHATIAEALKLQRSSVPQNVHIHTHFDASAAALACTVGSTELQQIIVNLVNNSIHAIGPDEGRIDITVEAHRDRSSLPIDLAARCDYVRMRVADSGCGMRVATRERIFEPFFTTKPQGKGTGLGLSIVHGIVHGYGGSIEVASELGRGATFTVWLPMAETATAATPASPATNSHGSGQHILYVDDDSAIVFLIQRLLEKSGYRVTSCDVPRQALDLVAANPHAFDVLVTDLSMPGMNGFELIEALRKIRDDLPAIMTSGYVREEDQARALQLSIGNIILKPNTVDELGRELHTRCAQLNRHQS